MTDKTTDTALPERTMLYRIGDMIRCGEHSLDYIIAEGEAELKDLLKSWFKTPQEAADADAAAKEEETQKLLQAQIQANKDAGAKTPTPPARKPKSPKAVKGASDATDNAKTDIVEGDGEKPADSEESTDPAPDAPENDKE